MALSVGGIAPDFELLSTAGKIRLAGLLTRGRVLLAFYPKDNTSG